MAVVGQFFRTAAMYTAGSNFTHMVASKKKPNHALITHGVYRYADALDVLDEHSFTCGYSFNMRIGPTFIVDHCSLETYFFAPTLLMYVSVHSYVDDCSPETYFLAAIL